MKNAKLFDAIEEIRINHHAKVHEEGKKVYKEFFGPMLKALKYLVGTTFIAKIEPPSLIFKQVKYISFVLSQYESAGGNFYDAYFFGPTFSFDSVLDHHKALPMLDEIGVYSTHNTRFCNCCTREEFNCGRVSSIKICEHMCMQCGSEKDTDSTSLAHRCKRCSNIAAIKEMVKLMFEDEDDFEDPDSRGLCETRHRGKFRFFRLFTGFRYSTGDQVF